MSITAHYSLIRDELQFYLASYQGGRNYRNPPASTLATAKIYSTQYDTDSKESYQTVKRSYTSYLIAHPAEKEAEFEARTQFAAPVSICAPIVDAYANSVTANVKREYGKLAPFTGDVDFDGTPLDEQMENFARDFCIFGFSYAVLDTDNVTPKVFHVPPTNVAWVTTDDFGRIEEFAWINDAVYSWDVAPTAQRLIVRCVNKDGWSIREGTVDLGGNATIADQKHLFATIQQTPLQPELEGELPVVVGYYERDTSITTPLGLSLIADTAHIARQIYNTLSWCSNIHQKTMIPILVMPVKRTGGQLPPNLAKEVGTDRALVTDSEAGNPGFISPSTEPSKELREHCIFLAQWAFKLQGLTLAADTSTQIQSGASLRTQAREFESKAKKFANKMQRFEMRVLHLFSKLAGINPADSEVQITYPKRFTLPDMSENIANALSVIGVSASGIDIGLDSKIEAVKQLLSSAFTLSDDALEILMKDVRASMIASEADAKAINDLDVLVAKVKTEKLNAASIPVANQNTGPSDQTSIVE
jgi:hypothetical protein